jgi:hypothetical protein
MFTRIYEEHLLAIYTENKISTDYTKKKKKKVGKEVRNANKFQRNTIFVNFRMKDISGPVWLLKQ